MMDFTPFPKLSRLTSSCCITEKLDGTNAQVVISPTVETDREDPSVTVKLALDGLDPVTIRVGSRNRWITPGKETDNYGFAGWVRDHAIELSGLGVGQHFGEWYGNGIQRGYGLKEKRFALFNVDRWGAHNPNTPACCSVVPILYRGAYSDVAINDAMLSLHDCGSFAVPFFQNPEGVVVYLKSARTLFKKTFEHDTGKWRAAA
ncbi:hypothetical protein CN074_25010 [Sinorhizobium medicae]|uniref:RNA ligase family protein n=1 Tax=Sinorhizobium medicae TaxID=110321 RepID=UPI000FD90A90|nr:RNA ligase family protein [Sinorhizobium medicae]RVH84250.1 hypothetical protein CN201_26785 [Sinorhizobium medicae]RVP63858.1 hypothetical protein CN074_25010 [Sinorhizobium medicae]